MSLREKMQHLHDGDNSEATLNVDGISGSPGRERYTAFRKKQKEKRAKLEEQQQQEQTESQGGEALPEAEKTPSSAPEPVTEKPETPEDEAKEGMTLEEYIKKTREQVGETLQEIRGDKQFVETLSQAEREALEDPELDQSVADELNTNPNWWSRVRGMSAKAKSVLLPLASSVGLGMAARYVTRKSLVTLLPGAGHVIAGAAGAAGGAAVAGYKEYKRRKEVVKAVDTDIVGIARNYVDTVKKLHAENSKGFYEIDVAERDRLRQDAFDLATVLKTKNFEGLPELQKFEQLVGAHNEVGQEILTPENKKVWTELSSKYSGKFNWRRVYKSAGIGMLGGVAGALVAEAIMHYFSGGKEAVQAVGTMAKEAALGTKSAASAVVQETLPEHMSANSAADMLRQVPDINPDGFRHSAAAAEALKQTLASKGAEHTLPEHLLPKGAAKGLLHAVTGNVPDGYHQTEATSEALKQALANGASPESLPLGANTAEDLLRAVPSSMPEGLHHSEAATEALKQAMDGSAKAPGMHKTVSHTVKAAIEQINGEAPSRKLVNQVVHELTEKNGIAVEGWGEKVGKAGKTILDTRMKEGFELHGFREALEHAGVKVPDSMMLPEVENMSKTAMDVAKGTAETVSSTAGETATDAVLSAAQTKEQIVRDVTQTAESAHEGVASATPTPTPEQAAQSATNLAKEVPVEHPPVNTPVVNGQVHAKWWWPIAKGVGVYAGAMGLAGLGYLGYKYYRNRNTGTETATETLGSKVKGMGGKVKDLGGKLKDRWMKRKGTVASPESSEPEASTTVPEQEPQVATPEEVSHAVEAELASDEESIDTDNEELQRAIGKIRNEYGLEIDANGSSTEFENMSVKERAFALSTLASWLMMTKDRRAQSPITKVQFGGSSKNPRTLAVELKRLLKDGSYAYLDGAYAEQITKTDKSHRAEQSEPPRAPEKTEELPRVGDTEDRVELGSTETAPAGSEAERSAASSERARKEEEYSAAVDEMLQYMEIDHSLLGHEAKEFNPLPYEQKLKVVHALTKGLKSLKQDQWANISGIHVGTLDHDRPGTLVLSDFEALVKSPESYFAETYAKLVGQNTPKEAVGEGSNETRLDENVDASQVAVGKVAEKSTPKSEQREAQKKIFSAETARIKEIEKEIRTMFREKTSEGQRGAEIYLGPAFRAMSVEEQARAVTAVKDFLEGQDFTTKKWKEVKTVAIGDEVPKPPRAGHLTFTHDMLLGENAPQEMYYLMRRLMRRWSQHGQSQTPEPMRSQESPGQNQPQQQFNGIKLSPGIRLETKEELNTSGEVSATPEAETTNLAQSEEPEQTDEVDLAEDEETAQEEVQASPATQEEDDGIDNQYGLSEDMLFGTEIGPAEERLAKAEKKLSQTKALKGAGFAQVFKSFRTLTRRIKGGVGVTSEQIQELGQNLNKLNQLLEQNYSKEDAGMSEAAKKSLLEFVNASQELAEASDIAVAKTLAQGQVDVSLAGNMKNLSSEVQREINNLRDTVELIPEKNLKPTRVAAEPDAVTPKSAPQTQASEKDNSQDQAGERLGNEIAFVNTELAEVAPTLSGLAQKLDVEDPDSWKKLSRYLSTNPYDLARKEKAFVIKPENFKLRQTKTVKVDTDDLKAAVAVFDKIGEGMNSVENIFDRLPEEEREKYRKEITALDNQVKAIFAVKDYFRKLETAAEAYLKRGGY